MIDRPPISHTHNTTHTPTYLTSYEPEKIPLIHLSILPTGEILTFLIYLLHTRETTAMSDLFKCSEHLKLNHYNYMSWRNLIYVHLLAVDAYESQSATCTVPLGPVTRTQFALTNKTRKRDGKRPRAFLSARAENTKPKSALSIT